MAVFRFSYIRVNDFDSCVSEFIFSCLQGLRVDAKGQSVELMTPRSVQPMSRDVNHKESEK